MGIKRRIARRNARAKFIEDVKFTLVVGIIMTSMFLIPIVHWLFFGYVL